MKPNKAPKSGHKKCGAKNRQGKPCRKHPMKGKQRCGLHGGKSTGAITPKGIATAAAAPLKHGAYSKMFRNLLSQTEKKAHKEIIEGLESDEFKAADKIMRESIAMLLITASKMDDPARILGEVRNQLKDLKVSRVGREGEEHKIDIKQEVKIDVSDRIKQYADTLDKLAKKRARKDAD